MSKVTVAGGGGGGGGGGGILPVPGTKLVKMPVRITRASDYIYRFCVKIEPDGLPIPEPGNTPGWSMRLNVLVVVRQLDKNKCVWQRLIGAGLSKWTQPPGFSISIDTAYCVQHFLGARMNTVSIEPLTAYGWDNATSEIFFEAGFESTDIVDAYFIVGE